ncbi:MAG: cytochrome c oxidase assembly protein, partial [Actinomycetota bacterium]
CVSSPLDRAGMEWLSWHMVAHVLEMFYLPVLFVLAAPGSLFSAAAPALAKWMAKRIASPIKQMLSVLRSPVVAVLCFNLVMVGWHVPVVFNWASAHTFVHELVMVPTFFFAGVVFWRLILSGPGREPTTTRRGQVVAVIVTAFVMIVLAMWMAIGAKTAWYSMYVSAHGEAAALKDQHLAAGVLWVCGDLWAIPAFVLIAMRLLKASGGVTNSVDRILNRSRGPLV